MTNKTYVPTHLHSCSSMLDGIIRLPDLIEKLKKNNMPACAITDHGNMFNALKFYKACKSANINPIVGVEIYLCDNITDKTAESRKNNHIVLMAKNYVGYKNLIKIVSIANTVGFYYKPRVDIETISKYSEGIIASSACLQGEICQSLLGGKYDGAKKIAATYKNIFHDDFYIEIMRSGLEEQQKIEAELLQICKELSIKPIATNDCHYLDKEDAFVHEVALCIGMNKKITDSDRMSFGTEEFYLKTPEEMSKLYEDIPEAIDNTVEISNKCNLEIPFHGVKLMKYKLPNGEVDSFSYLKKLCRDGWIRYGLDKIEDDRYKERIRYELDVIQSTKLSDYFLTVADICRYADNNGIGRNMGRGSAGGSLISYLLGITGVDPIKYNLIFERFYNKGRGKIREENGEYYLDGSPPDIDVDLSWLRRNEILEYVNKKWINSCQIITFNTMSARSAVKDVARTLNVDFALSNKITSHIPKTPGITIKEAIEKSDELGKFSIQHKKLFKIAEKLEGNMRNASIHAAGVIISDKALDEIIPLAWDAKNRTVITGYDMGDCELSGLQKVDLLGLRTIDAIEKTCRLINENICKIN